MSPDVQEYNQDQRLVTLNQQLNNKLSVVNLEYLPSSKNAEASMSFHLTTREKNEIKQALNNQQNQQAIKQLKALINPKIK
jgi:(p)ppGpp synthase/HD superfamily hydrolase